MSDSFWYGLAYGFVCVTVFPPSSRMSTATFAALVYAFVWFRARMRRGAP